MSASDRSPRKICWEYDEDANVLYVSFGRPRKAETLDLGSGVFARYG